MTEVDLSAGDDVKVAAGSPIEDEDGKRQGVVMFPPGTEALVVNRNGTGNTVTPSTTSSHALLISTAIGCLVRREAHDSCNRVHSW